jgi:hypothetical protein
VIELPQVVREESAGQIAAVGPLDDGLDAPFDLADARRAPPAAAGDRLVHRHREIADAIAKERHAEVVEVGDHHFAEFARLGRLSIAQDLDDVPLRHDMVPRVRLAFVRDAGELAAAVLVEHLASERRLDEPAALARKRLCAGHHGANVQVTAAVGLHPSGEQIERLGVAVEQDRPGVADRIDDLLHSAFGELEHRDEGPVSPRTEGAIVRRPAKGAQVFVRDLAAKEMAKRLCRSSSLKLVREAGILQFMPLDRRHTIVIGVCGGVGRSVAPIERGQSILSGSSGPLHVRIIVSLERLEGQNVADVLRSEASGEQ